MTEKKEVIKDWQIATELLHKAVNYFNRLNPGKKATYNDIESLRKALEIYHDHGYISYQGHKYMNMINARINKCTPGGKAGYILAKMLEKRRHLMEQEILLKAEKFRIFAEKQLKGKCFWCLKEIDNVNDHRCDCLNEYRLCVEDKK